MAYTDPRTFVTSEIVTATIMNTHLKDQLRWIGGGAALAANEGRGTTLPTSPVDGQLFVYTADSSSGAEWLCKYNSADAGSYKWHVIGGAPLYAIVDTSETTTSTTYAALATAGPTVTVPVAGDYRVEISCHLQTFASGTLNNSFMSYDLGASAADDTRAFIESTSSSVPKAGTRTRIHLAVAAATAITAKYRSADGNSVRFQQRLLSATPIRIG